jgi:hypothetical protein
VGATLQGCPGVKNQWWGQPYRVARPIPEASEIEVNPFKTPNITFAQLVDELGSVDDGRALPEIVDQLLAEFERSHPGTSGGDRGLFD